jgi:putative spermidine/putrescine transport system ATP-binding protein
VLSLRGVEVDFASGVRALDGLDLDVEQGELLALLGPSGCGKTTTLRVIAGLIRPSGGDVMLRGSSVLAVPPEQRGAVMVFQQHGLFPFRTVGENVAFGLKVRKTPRSEIRTRVAGALVAVQLANFEDRWPDELSGGQRQRVALARALVVEPSVLLLDEPLSHLEPNLRDELQHTIVKLQRAAGITTVLVTHDHAEAFAMADTVAVMFDGRIRQVGAPSDLLDRPADAAVARFLGAEGLLDPEGDA